jgi:hypothetical protein
MAAWYVDLNEWYSEQHPAVKVLVVLGGGGVAVAAGVFAAPAVGALASAAGLGVAGGTLSGAAASSAGLAALGGGSMAAGGIGVGGGTAVVAAATGAAGAGGATYLSHKADEEGSRTREYMRRAVNEHVDDGDIRFEDEG